jgi:universal stress protein E
MKRPTSVLAALDHGSADAGLAAKASQLAARFDARLELFQCDAEHAYAMKHEYEPSHNVEFRRDCMDQALAYLAEVRRTLKLLREPVSVSAACESPLYEGIVGKVQQSQPDLVVKSAGGLGAGSWRIPDSNDWQLMRKCPTTLMLNRGRIWRIQPRIAAAVDISAEETDGLAGKILETAEALRSVYDGELDVIYSAPPGLERKTRDAYEQALRKLVQASNVSSDRIHILDGQPEMTLPAFVAQRVYDVLVMGALTHKPGSVALVGTLTTKLVDTINCDFVLVKADPGV